MERVQAVLTEGPVAMAQAVQKVSLEDESLLVMFRDPKPIAQTLIKDRIVECLLYQ